MCVCVYASACGGESNELLVQSADHLDLGAEVASTPLSLALNGWI